jgi:type I restriction-modification system DNA methylase subunit
MTESNQKQLGKTLRAIADQLRGAMNADDFRDYMLSFLFLRYLSDNYETAAKKELGRWHSPLSEGVLSMIATQRGDGENHTRKRPPLDAQKIKNRKVED